MKERGIMSNKKERIVWGNTNPKGFVFKSLFTLISANKKKQYVIKFLKLRNVDGSRFYVE